MVWEMDICAMSINMVISSGLALLLQTCWGISSATTENSSASIVSRLLSMNPYDVRAIRGWMS